MRSSIVIVLISTIQMFAVNAKAETCSIMKKVGGENEVVNVSGLTVVSGEDLDRQFDKAGVDKNLISAIICIRKSVVPTPNDKHVLLHGYPLYIGSRENGENKLVVLEFTLNDGYRTRLISGHLTDAEQDEIALVLSSY